MRCAGATIPFAIDQDPALDRALRDAVRDRRCVFVAGLPGVGKSLVVRRASELARDAGRAVHLLQWDVARLAFDTPAILARYPEAGGVTHAAIRIAVGLWARDAVRRWHLGHPGASDVLVGETPLAGERLMELARPRDDAIEPVLAGEATLFVVPAPSREVRRAIEDARAKEMADPRHERDAASAPPHLVRSHWEEIERVASALGVAHRARPGGYDADVYAAAYAAALRHRHVTVLPLTHVLEVRRSAHEPPRGAAEVVPSAAEAAEAMERVARLPPAEIERRATEWYRV